MDSLKKDRKRKIYIEFLNRCGLDIEEWDDSLYLLFKYQDYERFIEGMVLMDFNNGMNPGKLSIKYGVNLSKIKYIIYTKRKRRSMKINELNQNKKREQLN